MGNFLTKQVFGEYHLVQAMPLDFEKITTIKLTAYALVQALSLRPETETVEFTVPPYEYSSSVFCYVNNIAPEPYADPVGIYLPPGKTTYTVPQSEDGEPRTLTFYLPEMTVHPEAAMAVQVLEA